MEAAGLLHFKRIKREKLKLRFSLVNHLILCSVHPHPHNEIEYLMELCHADEWGCDFWLKSTKLQKELDIFNNSHSPRAWF